jgi:hypothetical protein
MNSLRKPTLSDIEKGKKPTKKQGKKPTGEKSRGALKIRKYRTG